MAESDAIEPQAIEFYGDEILAVQAPLTGRIYVPFARLCDNLGIDRGSQVERIREHEVLKDGLITLKLHTAGGIQDTQCLRLDLIPFWLAGINTNRVKTEVQDKLVLYQQSAGGSVQRRDGMAPRVVSTTQTWRDRSTIPPIIHTQNKSEPVACGL